MDPLTRRTGVLGGTFDPVHIGHLVLAEHAREQLELDTVLFMPAGHPWRKTGRDVTTAGHRVAMVRLAVQGNPWFDVSALEADRAGPSYTADTLEELHRQTPGADLFLILGEDALADLPNWRWPERILETATIAVAARVTEPPAGGDAAAALPGGKARIVHIQMPLIEISATDIRQRVAQGRSIRYLVPRPVEEYIREHGLYGGRK